MKTSLAVLFVGALLALAGPTASSPAEQPFTLVGRVTDAATGEPLERVRIFIRGERALAETDRDGLFRIESTTVGGPVEISLQHRCYHTVRVEVDGNPRVDGRRIEMGMPFDYEKYAGYAPPLGGCRR